MDTVAFVGRFILLSLFSIAMVSDVSPASEFKAKTTPKPVFLGAVDDSSNIPLLVVASIRENVQSRGWKIEFTGNGFSATGVTVRQLVEEAYGIFEEDRVLGGPSWIKSLRFDIKAKVDDVDVPTLQRLDLSQRELMLQKLLSDRFMLTIHQENKDRPIYALTIAKGGPRVQETAPGNVPVVTIKGIGESVTRSRPGQLTVSWFTMAHFAKLLSPQLDRHVTDETGLKGHYDFSLDWETEAPPTHSGPAPNSTEPSSLLPPSPSGPSIFDAIQNQLGLKLEPKIAAVEVLIIDNVVKPTEN